MEFDLPLASIAIDNKQGLMFALGSDWSKRRVLISKLNQSPARLWDLPSGYAASIMAVNAKGELAFCGDGTSVQVCAVFAFFLILRLCWPGV